MTPAQVRVRVAEVAAQAGDDERAHGMEDRLWLDVLAAIASGAEDPAELATEALKTGAIDFSRWCA